MILIISAENDSISDSICNWLTFYGKKFIRINENRRLTKVDFDFDKEVYKISINNFDLCLNDIKTVYYRNGCITFNVPFEDLSEEFEKFYTEEYKSVRDFIYYFLKKSCARIYGNLINKKVNKLQVLFEAKQIGFRIPSTYILSSISNLHITKDSSKKYITKSISEMQPIFSKEGMFLNYTRDLEFSEIENEKDIIPTIIQDKIEKEFEVRVFFFEKAIWAIATFDLSNGADVRTMNTHEKKYNPFQLPKTTEEKVFILVEKLGLKCGTLDLLKKDKEFYFLEVNPLGQFAEVSYYGNYNIEKYIGELL